MSVIFLFFGFLAICGAEDSPSNPLPKEFINHAIGQDDKILPVDKNQIVDLLIHKLKTDPKAPANATDELKAAASKFLNGTKLDRLVRAVESLNLTQDHVQTIASEMSSAATPEHADKVRRAVEDAFVFGKPPPFQRGPPFPGPPRFGGTGLPQNPFFTTPLTSPALDMDLDRLLFLATPSLGIERAFELSRILHDLNSPRSEVFKIQEQFQRNMTEPEASALLHEYEQKAKSAPATTPSTILESTASLSGLNKTDTSRFTRAIESLGPLNTTQAQGIHKTIQDHGLNKTELNKLSNDIETLTTTPQTTTPETATGQAWVFSNNSTNAKRAIDSSFKMFSSNRACGFSIKDSQSREHHPWNAIIQCVNGVQVSCIGALISNNDVLTSASCILACGSEPVTIKLGDNSFTRELQVSGVSAVVNPKYSASNPTMDMGVITFSPPVDFNKSPLIYPICLLGQETDDPSIICELITGQQPIVTRCHQPGNNACSQLSSACIEPSQCFQSHQKSATVICYRASPNDPQAARRYYLWGVTTSQAPLSPCTQSLARTSDNLGFAMNAITQKPNSNVL